MKRIFYHILFPALTAALVVGCTREETPVPSEHKNWLEIVEPVNPDEVDLKIWNIYKETGVPVFYCDTLGAIDYGMVDEDGNPVLSYQRLNATADMTNTSIYPSTSVTYVQTWMPGEKAKMLPVLGFIESDLLPLAKQGGVDIPVILVAATGTMNYMPASVFRTMNVVVVCMNQYADTPAAKREMRRQFLVNCRGRAWDDALAPFYKVTEDLMSVYTADPWKGEGMTATSKTWSSFFTPADVNWKTVFDNCKFLSNYDANMTSLQNQISASQALLAAGTITPQQSAALQANIAKATAMRSARQNETLWTVQFNRYRPEAFGFVTINAMPVATVMAAATWTDYNNTARRSEDYATYFNLLLNNTREQLDSAWGAWPVVMRRLDLLRSILHERGIDIEDLK